MNRFISEKDVEEAKQKRQEEWEKARAEGRELPEEKDEFVDNRSLYERLKEQKDRKQEDFEDQLKFKNMIYKGLNDEDASFLSTVAKKQAEIDAKRFDTESEELQEYRLITLLENDVIKSTTGGIVDAALEETPTTTTTTTEVTKKAKIAADFIKKGKSQSELLSGVVRKRKAPTTSDELIEKKPKPLEESCKSKAEDDKPLAIKTGNTGLTSLADYSSSSSEDDT